MNDSHDLTAALRRLHVDAGEPSSRVLADRVKQAGGFLSHSTINDTIRGHRTPGWPVVEQVVSALGGDSGQFRKLWLATHAPGGKPRAAAVMWHPACVICAIVIPHGPLPALTAVAGDPVCADHVWLRSQATLATAVEIAAGDVEAVTGRPSHLPSPLPASDLS